MADDEAKVLAAAKKLPLAERVEHKNWKVRSEAWQDVQASCERAFSSDDPAIDEAGPLFVKGVADANANAMDKALDALCAWLSKADESHAGRLAPGVSATIASKCLKARPATLNKASDSCLLMIELEQHAAVVEALLKALGDKVPKVVVAALDILLKAVSDFGATVVDIKPIIKALPAVYGHNNAGVRDKAKELTVALAASAGAGIVQATLVEKMTDAMKKDVESTIAALPPGKRHPERYTRREAAARAAAGPGNSDDGGGAGGDGDGNADGAVAMDIDGGAEVDAGMDAYEFADPVDILCQLNKAMVAVGDDSVAFWECFESKKWNIRKGALDKVRDLAKSPRLATGDYGDLCRELRKVLAKDANINCAAAAAEAAGALAQGLRRDFSQHARQLAGPLMERFKEKNTSMSRCADEALRTMVQHCYTMLDISDDVLTALGHKNPKVRLDTLRLLRDMLDGAERTHVAKCKDALLPAVVKLAPEADANIREAAQSALVAFALKLGSFSAIQSALGKLDDARTKLIEEAVVAAAKAGPSTAVSRAPSAGKAAAVPGAAKPPPRSVSSRPPSSRSSPKALAPKNANVSSSSSRLGSKPAAAAVNAPRTRSAGASTAATGGASTAAEDAAPVTSGRFTLEEAEQYLIDAVGATVVEELRSPQWQARLESMTTIVEKATASASDPSAAAFVLCLPHLPGWTEKNFQVLNKSLEIITLLAKQCPGFAKIHAAIGVEGAGDKLHELKHRIQATDALNAMAEAVGPRFVAAQLHARAVANKNPKALSEALTWLATAVDDFGLVALDVTALISWMIADLGSPNAPVRTQAMKVLGRCHAQVGGGLLPQLAESLKPAQLTALEDIFDKNPRDPEYQPTRKVRGARTARTTTGGVASDDNGVEDDADGPMNLEDLLPRVDISGSLNPSLISRISSANWKERNAALEEIEGLLREAGGRVTPDIPADVFSALRGRLGDTNRNLAARALLLLAKLADAIGSGPHFDRLARQAVLAPALGTLSDNKKQVRDAVVTLLESWLPTCPADRLFGPVADAIGGPKCSPDGKVAAVTWMIKAIDEGKCASADATKCAEQVLRAVAVAAADKSGAVRDAGGQLAVAAVTRLGGDTLMKALGSLDGATKTAAESLVQKVLSASTSSTNACDTGAAPSSSANAGKITRITSTARSPAGPSSRPTSASLPASSSSLSRPSGLSVAEQEYPPILCTNSAKIGRARLYRPRPGRFEAPPSDELEVLEVAFTNVASDDFRALLFSREFKDHVKAADELIAAIPELIPEISANLDLVLRWAVVRLCEGNPQASVRILEAVKVILEALATQGYRMSEFEAGALLPAVVERSGHNQVQMRARHRDVMRAACDVCPTPRVLDFLTQGLTSKNARTKLECCEEITEIIAREGVAPVATSKAKPMIAVAGLLKERDGTVRAAALAAIEELWIQGGSDAMWKLIGKLELREKATLEDKLKRSTRRPAVEQQQDEEDGYYEQPDDMEVDIPTHEARGYYGNAQGSEYHYGAGATVPRDARTPELEDNGFGGRTAGAGGALSYARPAFTPPNALDITPNGDDVTHPSINAASGYGAATPPPHAHAATHNNHYATEGGISTPVPGGVVAADDTTAPTPIPAAVQRRVVPAEVARIEASNAQTDVEAFERRWTGHLREMTNPSLPDAINATKQLCADIMSVADANNPQAPPPSQGILAIMSASTERLFAIVLAQLRAIFDEAEREAAAGEAPSSRGCKFALNVMLQGMGVPDIARSVPQGTLREAIALLLARLVDDRGLMVFDEGPTLVRAVNVLVAKMLEAADRNYSFAALLQLLRAPPPGLSPAAVPKFNELVVKCLIKLTKALQQSARGTANGVDLSALLFNLHDFFMFLGVEEIRRRSSADDKPLRMVKTILHELCKMQGHGIYNYTAGIPGRRSNPQPIIFAYIQMNLNSLVQSGVLQPSDSAKAIGTIVGQDNDYDCSGGAAAAPAGSESSSQALHSQFSSAPTVPTITDASAAMQTDRADAAGQTAAKAEVKQRLKDVMTRLVQKDAASQEVALVELLNLKRDHPQYVERYIAGTSDLFRRFIDQGMAKMEAKSVNDGGGDAGGNETVFERRDSGATWADSAAAMTRNATATSVAAVAVAAVTQGSGFNTTTTPTPAALHVPSAGCVDVLSPQSARSDTSQSSRLSSLRDRLQTLRVNADGGNGGATGLSPSLRSSTTTPTAAAAGPPRLAAMASMSGSSPAPAPVPAPAAPSSHLSVDQLSARLARLRGQQ